MHKILFICLTFVMMLSVFTSSAFAADTASITLTDAQGSVGDTVAVKVKLHSSGPVNTIALKLFEYDAEFLEFTGFADYSYLTSNKALPETLKTNPAFASFGLKNSIVFTSSNEDIVTLNFKILKNGQSELSFVPVIKDNAKEYSVSITPATITAAERVLGDIDADGKVSLADAVLLFNCSMAEDIYPIDYPYTRDLNGDGAFSLSDAILLFNYSVSAEMFPIKK